MKIGAYVVTKQAKQNYISESYDVRAWPGFELILDVIRRSGQTVEYVGEATAHKYDVVLMSITSDCDWWPFIAERAMWPKSKTRVIIGGPGVLNIRPFLPFGDVFVFGRGENLILDILTAEAIQTKVQNPSVAYADTFSVDGKYVIAQCTEYYPFEFKMSNGKPFKEVTIGCPNKCLFCGYTWHRKYKGDGSFAAGTESMSSGRRERTIIDLLKLPPREWQNAGPLRIVGLDGTSERLRFAVNKKITRDMWRSFLEGLASIPKPHQVKVYNIIGYPLETEDDWQEFVVDLDIVDKSLKPSKQWSILCHFTPFRPMPGTPSATWPISYRNYRGVISKRLKKLSMPGNVFFQGNRFWAVEGMGTDGLSTVIHSALCLRGTEEHTEKILQIAKSTRYWSGNNTRKVATLEHLFDMPSLFQKYGWDELPTRYLYSYSSAESIKRLSKFKSGGLTDKE